MWPKLVVSCSFGWKVKTVLRLWLEGEEDLGFVWVDLNPSEGIQIKH